MTTHYDVPGEHLVGALASTLKSVDAVSPPDWASFAKTAVHKEKSPSQPDWWYFRSASILRKIGVNGPIGTERLAKHYSGSRDRGAKPNRSEGGSRKVIRLIMRSQELGIMRISLHQLLSRLMGLLVKITLSLRENTKVWSG